MKLFRSLGVMASLLVVACAVYAYPTLAGFTGYGVLPTGTVAPANTVQVAADFYNTEDDATGSDNTIPIRVLLGASPNLEIGAGYSLFKFLDDDANSWNVNAKWATGWHLGDFAWGLGARFSSTEVDALDDTVQSTYAYFAGTGSFRPTATKVSPLVTGTFGVNWTNIDSDVFGENDAFRVFAGASVIFSNELSLAAEIQSKDSDIETDALYSLVARYPFNDVIAAQVGVTNADFTMLNGTGDGNVYAGVNVTFGEDEY